MTVKYDYRYVCDNSRNGREEKRRSGASGRGRKVVRLPAGKIRTVVVDDHRITRSFFESTVMSSERYELAASFAFARDALEYCRKKPVDLVVMDILMQDGIDGLTAARKLRQERPEIRIVLATSAAEARWLSEARQIGVEALWFKDYGNDSLLEVMDRTMAGKTTRKDETGGLRIGNAVKEEFTERELDVLRELVTCVTNEQIAQTLGISVNTVKTHIRHMLEKTGFTDRLELAVEASRKQIVVNDRELGGRMEN